ncbi:Glycosyl hydrolases family 43 [Nocardioides terrae]|uniref:Glycosyl hydrolases family 43 n=1 Tax=Nocardioides terrae TaxID=574651 RepID=A0A1I1LZ83_9ACTN|nr:glycoside hydrolase family 43 protein [Nocardioides terrae]SFC78429.1 Glycosyl hydrolases family 43 [Nocardioides terrae]
MSAAPAAGPRTTAPTAPAAPQQPAARAATPVFPAQDPRPVSVDGSSTTWRVGSTYRGVFADPDVAFAGGRWYAYATNTSGLLLPTLSSTDLSHWSPIHSSGGAKYDALAAPGAWTTSKSGGAGLWAPSVAPMGGGWTLAYAAQQSTLRGERHNCIGLARAASPTGPFRALAAPLECAPASPQGAIDPDLYVDKLGRNWMLWKFSGVPSGQPSTIYVRQLSADGTGWAPGSQAVPLVANDYGDGFEGDTIENPSMTTFRGVTYLFYSVNSYRSAAYATGYAVCGGPTGPCQKVGPLLTTARSGTLGPGGASAFVVGGSLHLAYHAWDPGRVGSLRRLHVASLMQLDDATLTVAHAG